MPNSRCLICVTLLVALGLGGPGRGQADDTTRASSSTTIPEWLEALQHRSAFREHHTWGIFLGFGATQQERTRFETLLRTGTFLNPLTGEPFQDAKVFVFGSNSRLLEGLRVASDHLELHLLSSWEELAGQHFDFAICHSNGCTNALDAQRQGVMRVEHLYALGTDWTSKTLRPGDLRGATLLFFTMPGDPIWKIPAPNLVLDKDRIGWQFAVPFEQLRDIPQGVRNLFTQGRADPDRFPVIRLEPPPRPAGTRHKPFQAHFVLESYFPAIERWRRTEGPVQKALKDQVAPRGPVPGRDEQTKHVPLPPGGGGGGGGGGGSLPPTRGGIAPRTPQSTPRGGIAVDIRLTPDDVQTR